MKNYIPLLLVCALSFTPNVNANNAIYVVANITDTSIELNRQQIRNLFMGGAIPYNLKAISLPPENQTRVLFNTKVVGLTEARIQSYWAQMRFTGRKVAPKEVDSEILALEYLKNNKGTIAYLSSNAEIPSNLTIILEIE